MDFCKKAHAAAAATAADAADPPQGPTGTPFKGKIGGPTEKIGIFWIFEVFEFFFGVLGFKTSPKVVLYLLGPILH